MLCASLLTFQNPCPVVAHFCGSTLKAHSKLYPAFIVIVKYPACFYQRLCSQQDLVLPTSTTGLLIFLPVPYSLHWLLLYSLPSKLISIL